MKRTSGFTLIELLVVIVILSALAAILFPVFVKSREKGRQATCISNMKQIMLAVMAYNDDYDHTWPPSSYFLPAGVKPSDPYNSPPFDGSGYPVYTIQLIEPYEGKPSLLVCPDALPTYHNKQSAWFGSYGFNAGTGYNQSLFIDWTQVPKASGGQGADDMKYKFTLVKDSMIPNPSTVYAVMDAGSARMDANFASSRKNGGPTFYDQIYTFYIPGTGRFIDSSKQPTVSMLGSSDLGLIANDYNNGRHSGGIDVGFCDGHVKWQSGATIVEQANIMCGDLGAHGPVLDSNNKNDSCFYYGRE